MIAFVLGGGGMLGAVEVGMLQALFAADIRPDLVVGSSVGAINGAAVAGNPTKEATENLAELWEKLGRDGVFSGSIFERIGTLTKSGTHLHGNEGIARLVEDLLPGTNIEDLQVPFQCVAACIETATARWFAKGPLVQAILASTAVPGLLPPVQIDGKHYLDGGLVNSIPVSRARELGATEVYVLQVGRVEKPLAPPRWPWEVATVAFEIARRNRYAEELAAVPEGMTVHVLPSGDAAAPTANFRYRDTSGTRARIDGAYDASMRYLSRVKE